MEVCMYVQYIHRYKGQGGSLKEEPQGEAVAC